MRGALLAITVAGVLAGCGKASDRFALDGGPMAPDPRTERRIPTHGSVPSTAGSLATPIRPIPVAVALGDTSGPGGVRLPSPAQVEAMRAAMAGTLADGGTTLTLAASMPANAFPGAGGEPPSEALLAAPGLGPSEAGLLPLPGAAYDSPEGMSFETRIERAIEAEKVGDFYYAEQLYLANFQEVGQYGPADHRYGDMLRILGFFYHYRGAYEPAERHFKNYIQARARQLGEDASGVSDAMIELTGVYNFQGKFENSLELYERAAAIREKTDGAESAAVAQILGYWADALRRLGREADAAPIAERAASIRAKIGG